MIAGDPAAKTHDGLADALALACSLVPGSRHRVFLYVGGGGLQRVEIGCAQPNHVR